MDAHLLDPEATDRSPGEKSPTRGLDRQLGLDLGPAPVQYVAQTDWDGEPQRR